jgi:3-oxoacyl-[acyl-carrier protein] reductase
MNALVTGAGRGLGRAVALELAGHGWDVGLLARTRAQLDAVAGECRARGARAEVLVAAVDDARSVEAAFRRFAATFDRLDALVTCAGTGTFAPVAEAEPGEWERILAVNLTGTFLCCREAVRLMEPCGAGTIVNVLSIAAKVALPGASAYCASKWGALGLTKVLAEEVRRRGIRVAALCPGSIDTPFWDKIPHGLNRADMLRPEDVAAAVRFVLEQPAGIHTDELVVMPPKGIL